MKGECYLIITGGTGGHIFPSIAIAQELRNRGMKYKIVAIGPKIKTKAFDEYNTKVYSRYDKLSLIIYTLRLFNKVLSESKIIATGSYASFPALFWAWLLRKPYYLIEENVIPGRVVRMFSKSAKFVFLPFEEAKNYFKKKDNLLVTGVPVRSFNKVSKREAREILKIPQGAKVVLVIGGSQGSRKINRLVVKVAEKLDNYEFILIAGKDHDKLWSEVFIPRNMKVFEFFEDMSVPYMASDIAISRAGGSAIAELLYFKIPAIYIPYPKAKDNHQYYNAKAVADRKFGIMIKEDDLDVNVLKEAIIEVMNNREFYKKNLLKYDNSSASQRIVDYIQEAFEKVQ
ncbi:MAG: UDP-N-acetylglucosamine--N-acetylmuramyl-(pentapeptide) pyrophosphoryl-undecaprenol N-acetylglucosamine transferase [candidate division WOR-3 bacterium]|nr:UDP-N-acetylglucosamine--N-acetylmuramyl-(pentapeptide) pyrophosphoryl-undecaprenol N-acetylglucosamine transferase [candidate division WOR-3 bacterium]MCX7948118.1 UDP-N-acetylglucosamine--N-acetylmuramyl-(pentapeptide) pyrophosphoryl-undecaprenol N-acetylglucosamine transferase [candidate division WOR-3 bacterium]MDW8150804.1 UDP-N-acetylglucosamine--N-acetylmuramyl-(pentapeptide) pyrophosphoryl-undecaprenol N-acetylglucosamine transferase [candidate division WOR-3 bacterium]